MEHIKRIDPEAASLLIGELDAYQADLYPPDSNHFDSIKSLSADNVHILGGV
tara:strand:+ start:720 stop:875 length:156 start_codon:yes stop_codon:yes gene_type:complete